MQSSRGDAGQARAYIIVAQGDATAAAHEPRPIDPRSTDGVVMDEDVAMVQLDGGVLAADAVLGDLNVILGKTADGRVLRQQQEARGLLAGECRERDLESERHERESRPTLVSLTDGVGHQVSPGYSRVSRGISYPEDTDIHPGGTPRYPQQGDTALPPMSQSQDAARARRNFAFSEDAWEAGIHLLHDLISSWISSDLLLYLFARYEIIQWGRNEG